MSVRLRGTPKQDSAEAKKGGKELSVEWQIGVHAGDGPQVFFFLIFFDFNF